MNAKKLRLLLADVAERNPPPIDSFPVRVWVVSFRGLYPAGELRIVDDLPYAARVCRIEEGADTDGTGWKAAPLPQFIRQLESVPDDMEVRTRYEADCFGPMKLSGVGVLDKDTVWLAVDGVPFAEWVWTDPEVCME